MQGSRELTPLTIADPLDNGDVSGGYKNYNPRIHLTIHQSIIGLYDQILFLRLVFKALGFRFTVGTSLDPHSLNLMIEDFRPEICQTIEEFYRQTGKRISIVATEHLDYQGERILSYNEPLFVAERESDYISHSERARRFAGLVEATHKSRFLFTLGDYPHLSGVDILFPRCEIVRLPFPPLPMDAVARRARHKSRYNFVFTGAVTPFRKRILDSISDDFAVVVSKFGSNFRDRARSYLSSSVALNIPQYPGWIWSSPMRILYGLAMGRLTISPFLQPGSEIDRFTFMPGELSVNYLRETLANISPARTLETIEKYQAFAEESVRRSPIAKVIAKWAIAEGLI